MVDLHTHSTASDGTFSPTELAQEAHRAGISLFALTDHDTVEGVTEAQQAADQLGLYVLPGIEISVTWQPGELHMLGLGVDNKNETLRSLLKYAQEKRTERNRKMLDKFSEAHIIIDEERLADIAGGKVIGRPHFARYLVQEKKAKSIQDAFFKFLAKGRPFYVEKECLPLKDALQYIKKARGVPVLAHPMSLYLSWNALPAAIEGFKEQGLEGLEAWHSGARRSECVRLEALAQKLGLIVTAGSDFHGKNRKNVYLGRTCENMPIDDRFYTENLLPALKAAGSTFSFPSSLK